MAPLCSSSIGVAPNPSTTVTTNKKFTISTCVGYSYKSKLHFRERRTNSSVSSALPEVAATIAVAAITVGAAATLLERTKRASESENSSLKICENCDGSGICSECKGEGFILKKLSDESAERARMAAKNMATRYTAGLPKKWSYCYKCSSSRSCTTCKGTGKISG